ncbi:CdaR family protein [Desulfobacca acetoxidans]|uniref:YbbR family protein n=1 Tax=Desulfobacca acetoxidans (strain ATCC 700848 / DSM 11109 / ASRB2) TaxID=880072 RepID=F2NCP8_DESAR|nr:CdaR family protein [Desulfobacca acetoxidans]AEB09329.1 YbbR family protein [Desulfobacca acetoxidans DSM 11109]
MKKYLASLKKNKGLKFLALLLALIAWFAVGSEERTETTLQLALELTNIPRNLIVTNEIPTLLEVRVQGPRSVIRELTNEKLHKKIDLSGAKTGSHTIPLPPSSLNFPRGVVVTRIRPNALSITLDQALTRQLDVQPVIKGSPAPGFEVGEVILTPKQVLIRGPKRDLNQLKFINTIPIDINNLSSSIVKDVELDFKNLSITYLENEPLVVKITIRPKLQTKTFVNINVLPVQDSGTAHLSPSKVAVTVRGPSTNLEHLRPEDISAKVSLKNLKPGRYEVRVAVEVSDGLEVLKVAPGKIKVNLRRAKSP